MRDPIHSVKGSLTVWGEDRFVVSVAVSSFIVIEVQPTHSFGASSGERRARLALEIPSHTMEIGRGVRQNRLKSNCMTADCSPQIAVSAAEERGFCGELLGCMYLQLYLITLTFW